MPTNKHSDHPFDGQTPLDDEQLWDLLSLYVDGEADPAQAAIVEQMLSSDPAYRRDFDFLMQSSQTMHTMEEVEPPLSLREAVLAKTTGRPTLVGRLRAAWNRATTPAFGRYAMIGGAFAVAALGVAILWPRLNFPSGHGSPQSLVATRNTPSEHPVAINPTPPRIPDITAPNVTLLKPPVHSLQEGQARVTYPPKPTIVPIEHNNGNSSEHKVAKTFSGPQNHYLPKNNVPSPEGLQQVKLSGYPYDKKMDNETAPHHLETIVASAGNEFGPKVVPSEETSAPTSDSHGPSSVADTTPRPAPTVDPPKSRIRVVALPPADKQVLAEAVLRHTQPTQYGGSDHIVADDMQRGELLKVYKTSF